MIHKYKTEGISPKDFRNSQSLIELFKDLRDGNTDPKEALKDQINSKSGLGEINKGNKQSKSEDQISVIQNPKKVLDLRENIIDFFRDYSFFLSEAKYKAKYGKNIWESSSDLKNFRSTPFPFHSVGMGMHFCHKCPLLQLSQHWRWGEGVFFSKYFFQGCLKNFLHSNNVCMYHCGGGGGGEIP